MKNQNPIEILNEILLRMKYDMKLTLVENTGFVFEQNTANEFPTEKTEEPTLGQKI